MNNFKNQGGFTLLELLISMTIIAVIVGISLGGMRLGMSAREIGEQKADTYQRLKFIGEQISKKIKSLHPLFLKQKKETFFFEEEEKSAQPQRYLAFEGLEDSIRLITFANALSMVRKPPWMHEVRFYLGAHPETLERGIIMMERDLSIDDVFTEIQPDSPGVRHILLAKNVDHLRFRYFKMGKLTPEELEFEEDPSVKYKGEWVDTVIIKIDEEEPGVLFSEEEKELAFKEKNKISLPRAIEISIGLIEPLIPENNTEPGIVYLPPMIIPLHSGIEFTRPPVENEDEET